MVGELFKRALKLFWLKRKVGFVLSAIVLLNTENKIFFYIFNSI